MVAYLSGVVAAQPLVGDFVGRPAQGSSTSQYAIARFGPQTAANPDKIPLVFRFGARGGTGMEYQKPELTVLGKIEDLTQTGLTNVGNDMKGGSVLHSMGE